ncbi:class I SAM-dependent methyltransferase [Pseudorhodoplanes sp.]|uniref:class I SAM-dependent methyltransferase n=1 Tax=Pseudorhodoplanes sp. TaxID=1934341 RepID=UPI003D10D731
MSASVSNTEVKAFWETNPVAAEGISARPGTVEFFRAFDALREADDCEPWEFSNCIHGYSESKGLRVLDVGCGNGYVLAQYAKYGAEVTGVDLTQTAIDLSCARFDLAGLRGEFRLTDGDRLPFEDGTFDIACSMGVLHHIEAPRPMISEMRRVLKPGGTIILMLYYWGSWKYHVVLRMKRILDPRYRGKSQAEALNMNDGAGCPLAKVYTRAQARELLSGFSDHRFELNQLSWRQLLLGFDRLLRPVLPHSNRSIFARTMGWNLYVTARKPR